MIDSASVSRLAAVLLHVLEDVRLQRVAVAGVDDFRDPFGQDAEAMACRIGGRAVRNGRAGRFLPSCPDLQSQRVEASVECGSGMIPNPERLVISGTEPTTGTGRAIDAS